MDPNGFDHDDGMNAFTVEKSTVIRKKGVYVGGAPAYLMSQVHKERDLFNVVVSSSPLFGWQPVLAKTVRCSMPNVSFVFWLRSHPLLHLCLSLC